MFQKNSGVEKIMDKRRGSEGVSRFSDESLLSHSTKKLVREPLFFKEFLQTKNIMCGMGVSRFSVINLFVTVPKTFVEDSFCAVFQKLSGSETLMDRRMEVGGREHHDFPSKSCCLIIPKFFVREPFCTSKKLW